MRYWRARPIVRKKLGNHSGAEWNVLVAEVEGDPRQAFRRRVAATVF